MRAYVLERWHLGKPNVLRGTDERFLNGRVDAAFEGRRAFVAVDEGTGLAEVRLAAAVEGLVGVA